MILNSYAVLAGCASLLRLALGLVVLGLGVSAWRRNRKALGPASRTALEDRCYLIFLLALLLLGLNLASWPLLYLLLQSYVPEWPGVMCIYGVTQIGAGSMGTSRFLPELLQALQATKPALVFVSGAWFMLYLVNRRTRTSPLMSRLLVVLMVLGVLAVADAAAEAAYLAIPKKEEPPSAGCCTEAFDRADAPRLLPAALAGAGARPWLVAAYYGLNGGLLLGLFAATRRGRFRLTPSRLLPLLLGAALAFAVSAVFLTEVFAPAVLRLPYHHCPYDLIPKAPEALVGVALFVWGSFSVGWAGVLAWLGRCDECRPFLTEEVRKLLIMGLLCYAGSLGMMSVELALV
jgi:hypothetical protein